MLEFRWVSSLREMPNAYRRGNLQLELRNLMLPDLRQFARSWSRPVGVVGPPRTRNWLTKRAGAAPDPKPPFVNGGFATIDQRVSIARFEFHPCRAEVRSINLSEQTGRDCISSTTQTMPDWDVCSSSKSTRAPDPLSWPNQIEKLCRGRPCLQCRRMSLHWEEPREDPRPTVAS